MITCKTLIILIGLNPEMMILIIIVLVMIRSIIYFLMRKPKQILSESKDAKQNINISAKQNSPVLNIPDICPHCKNPNSKRIRLCEWCGNQIC